MKLRQQKGPLSIELLLPPKLVALLPEAVYAPLAFAIESALGIERVNALHATVTKEPGTPVEICARTARALGVDFCVTLEAAQEHFGSKPDAAAFFKRQLAELKQHAPGKLGEPSELGEPGNRIRPTVFVANHPFGGIEALALMILLNEFSNGAWKVMANDMLKIFPELSSALLYVDPFGTEVSQQKNLASIKSCVQFLRNSGTLGMFPAGSVSSYQRSQKRIVDDSWMPSSARIIQLTKADVVPVFFHGKNSLAFQIVSALSRTARLGLLIHEFVRNAPKELHVTVGKPISYSEISGIKNSVLLSEHLFDRVYQLEGVKPNPVHF